MVDIISLLIPILVGAVITGNIFGDQRKQIGKKAVFYTWKGINVVRSYVIPTNPNSTAQQTQRSFFADIVSYGSALLGSIVQEYWKLLAIGKSEFNAFVGANLDSMSSSVDWANFFAAKGTLLSSSITDAQYAGSNTTITFPTSATGNQLTTDIAVGVVVDRTSKKWYVNTAESATRADGTLVVTCEAGLTEANLKAYLFFVQRDTNGNLTRVSDSAYFALS